MNASAAQSSGNAGELARPPLPPAENRVYYPALNGLRAVAVLMVFAEHYLITSTPTLLEWGWTGVDIFFVLSGFLITGILLDTVDAPHRFRNFYVRRTLRIFPLYYAVLLAIVLLTPVFHWQWSRLWLMWPLYVGNYGPFAGWLAAGNYDAINYLNSASKGFALHFIHFWSLCVEEQFYLLWPFVVYKLRKVTVIRNLCLAAIVLVPLSRLVAQFYLPPFLIHGSILHRAMFFRLDGFLIGGLVACLMRSDAAAAMRRSAGTILLLSLIALCLTWGFAARVLHQGASPGTTVAWMSTVGFTLVDFVAAGILLLALKPDSLVYRVLTWRWLQQLGAVSYGFYVLHEIPLEVYKWMARRIAGQHVGHIGLVVAPIALVCTYSLAWLSFRYFESPFLRLKDRFTAEKA